MSQHPETTFIATMAGGPQIVTFALDELLRQGEPISEVIVVHLSPKSNDRTRTAIAKLAAEFSGGTYGQHACRLHFFPIRQGHRRMADITDETEASAAWQAIYNLVADLKAEQRYLHACIAGSRRMLALLFMSAALLQFDHQDRLWHMHTPVSFLEQARDGAIMHARPEDGVRLIEVPLIPLGAYFPAIKSLTQVPPAQVIASRLRWLDQTERHRCQTVIGGLTPKQKDVLRSFAEGKTPQEVGETLHIQLSTVDSHKTPILESCRRAWDDTGDLRIDYHFLRDKFGPFFGRFVVIVPQMAAPDFRETY